MTVTEALDKSMSILQNMIIPGSQAKYMSTVLDLLTGTKQALLEPPKEKEPENESV